MNIKALADKFVRKNKNNGLDQRFTAESTAGKFPNTATNKMFEPIGLGLNTEPETIMNNIGESESIRRNNEGLRSVMSRARMNEQSMNKTQNNTQGGVYDDNSFFTRLGEVESSNNYNAKNKSGAYGKYQFMPSTEKEIAGKLGYTLQQARTPKGQEAMVRKLTDSNISSLKRAGIPITNKNLWYAHNLGAGGARTLLGGGTPNIKHLRANLPKGMNPTVDNYKTYWGNKWDNISSKKVPNRVVINNNTEVLTPEEIKMKLAFEKADKEYLNSK